MLEFHLHLDKMKRKYPFPIPLTGLGYTTDFPVSQTVAHEKLFFSFVVKGTGNLRIDNQEYFLEAPCVFIQFPGVPMHHSSNGVWDELFAGYEPEMLPLFRKMNLLRRSVPTWKIENINEFMLTFIRVTDLVKRGTRGIRRSGHAGPSASGADSAFPSERGGARPERKGRMRRQDHRLSRPALFGRNQFSGAGGAARAFLFLVHPAVAFDLQHFPAEISASGPHETGVFASSGNESADQRNRGVARI